MQANKERAVALRSEGLSYSAIEKELGISRSTLSFWLRNYPWSEDIKVRLRQQALTQSSSRLVAVNRVRKIGFQFQYAKAEEAARKEFSKLLKSPAFVPGIFIYWTLGDKSGRGRIKVSNADPSMLRLFLRFLETVCGVKKDRIRLTITSQSDLNNQASEEYWQKELDFKPKNFYKTRVVRRKSIENKPKYGVCSVEIGDTMLKKKVLVWIELYRTYVSK